MEIVANIKKQKQEIDKVVGMTCLQALSGICIDTFPDWECLTSENTIYYAVTK